MKWFIVSFDKDTIHLKVSLLGKACIFVRLLTIRKNIVFFYQSVYTLHCYARSYQ